MPREQKMLKGHLKPGSRIPNPESRILKQERERGAREERVREQVPAHLERERERERQRQRESVCV